MKLSLITIHINNLEKSLYFYNTLLALPIIKRQPTGDNQELIFLGIKGETNLELIYSNKPTTYSGFSIGFNVENLEATKETLTKNGYPPKHEMKVSPTTTLCFFEGPNGEEIELIENKS